MAHNLCYVFVVEYNNIRKQGFHLTSKYQFNCTHKKDDSFELSFEENSNYMESFYGKNILDNICLIGDNGAGKSSLIELLSKDTPSYGGTRIRSNVFYVYRDDETFIVVNPDKYNLSKPNGWKEQSTHPLQQVVYYHNTPFYQLFYNKKTEYSYFADISTSYLWRNDYLNYLNINDIDEKPYSIDELYSFHQHEEDFRILKYLLKEKKQESEIVFPRYVNIKPHTINPADIDIALHLFKDNEFANELKEIAKVVEQNIASIEKIINCNFNEIAQENGALYPKRDCQIKNLMVYSAFSSYIIVFLINGIRRYDQYIKTIDEYKRICEILQNLANENYWASEEEWFIEQKISYDEKGYLTAIISQAMNFANSFMANMPGMSAVVSSMNAKGISYSYDMEEDKSWLFVNSIYWRIKKLLSDNLFDPHLTPIRIRFSHCKERYVPLSAGEYSLLSIQARIFEAYSNALENYDSSKNKYKSFLLLLDEPEISFHVEWQRKFFSHLLNLLNNQFDFKLTIITATHSPILLSDFKSDDVIYLMRDDDGYCKVEDRNNKKTLGANIYNLFKDNFFIKGVPIGEFAQNKILKLFKHLREPQYRVQKDDTLLISEVADPIIKASLQELLKGKSIDDEIAYHRKRIEELVKEKGNDKD